MAQLALLFKALLFGAGRGDVFDRGRQTTYDTGYIAVLFDT
jgi:hypothetical protein